nr:hypothetical protein [Tanacetum cinerariifolium]
MTTLVDKAILLGADNRPLMLEKDMYDSWKSIMELYMINRQHGRMILESVENGPLIWPSIEENRVTRPKKYSELFAMEAIQAECDVKATNIVLQGLPPEVYALVNNHKVTKELWERIQLLMQGTSLTKQERECKLYDEFDKFSYKKGETLREFYLRFSQLLNDMNTYNIKLELFQVNTKFLNTLSLEWSKFVTDVKLVRDLHTTNVDQLHAYLGQHEFHANEKGDDPIDAINHMMSFLTTVVTSRGDKLLSLLVLQEHTHQDQGETILGNKGLLFVTTTKGKATCPNSALNQRGNEMIHDPRITKAQATQTVITHNAAYQADDLDANDSDCDEINSAKVALMANLSHYGSDDLAESETEITSDSNIIPYSQYVSESQQAAVQNSNSHAQQDALILSVIEQLKTQVVNYTKINMDNKSVNDTLTAELERYKDQSVEIDNLKQTLSKHLKEKESLMQTVTLLKNDFHKEESRNIDREIALEKQIKFFHDHTTKQALGFQNPFYLKKAQQLEPKLYDGNVIEKTNAIVICDFKETLIRAEDSRSKMLLKQKDHMMSKKKINTTPVDYNSVNSPEPTPSTRPTRVEVPKELPKVSMVNTSLKKLKHHLDSFDVVVKERTTTTAITKGTWRFEHTKACFRDKIIPFVKALKDLFNSFDQFLVDELSKVQNVFHQMEHAVEQHRVKSKTFEVKMNKVLNENERLLEQSQEKDMVIKKLKERIKSLSGNMKEDKIKKELEEIETMNIELDHRVTKLIAENEHLKQTYKKLYDSIKSSRIRSKEQPLKDNLRKLKGKAVVDEAIISHPIDPEMLKVPKL